MNVETIFSNHSANLAATRANSQVDGSSFGSVFNAALQMHDDTNALQHKADQLQLDYITGRTNDMLSVIMAQEQASTSLNFTVQVTNRVIEAYREIMRIQL